MAGVNTDISSNDQDQIASGNTGDFGNNWGSNNKTIDMKGGFMGDPVSYTMPAFVVGAFALAALWLWKKG